MSHGSNQLHTDYDLLYGLTLRVFTVGGAALLIGHNGAKFYLPQRAFEALKQIILDGNK